ncbi:MAG: WecB/TagA/CpsF family glycosyltransferase [bacterium]|nr:WecB/TagA/CpsF family glycosyltransferase [bacterium]
MKKEVLGVEVSDISQAEALVQVKDLIDRGEKGYIVTPNPEMILEARVDSEFRNNLNSAFLSLPDGFYLFQAAKLLGKNLREVITGVDFTYSLAALAEEHGYRVFLLGGKEGVAQKAKENLQKLFPRINIVGAFSGGLLEKNEEEIRQNVQKESIDILVVAFGYKKQEAWIVRNLPKLDTKVAIGVGGALDYISGEVNRAPVWMRKIGLEWFYRLLHQPIRIKRQIKLPLFVYLVLKEKFSKRAN